jgi:hypothetical protein
MLIHNHTNSQFGIKLNLYISQSIVILEFAKTPCGCTWMAARRAKMVNPGITFMLYAFHIYVISIHYYINSQLYYFNFMLIHNHTNSQFGIKLNLYISQSIVILEFAKTPCGCTWMAARRAKCSGLGETLKDHSHFLPFLTHSGFVSLDG